jgi:hypothetical protein
VYPAIQLDVERTYYGEQETTVEIIGFNTCFLENGEWVTTQIAGKPWLVPGDRVFVLAQYMNRQNKDGVETTYLRLHTALFILDRGPLGTNRLYTYHSAGTTKSEAGGAAAITLTDILSSMMREPEATRYSLDELIMAVGGGNSNEEK